jgi:uncharacterized protein (TIGR03437 family)
MAPNEIVSLFGASLTSDSPLVAQPDSIQLYPFQLNNAQVTFDGVPAPLLYANSGQINLIAPRSLQSKVMTHVCALSKGAATNCLDVPVQPAAPQLFRSGLNASYAAALNQDASINSAQNPAAVGSIVSLFATGLGVVSPAVPDGGISPLPSPMQNLKIQVDLICFSSTSPIGLDNFPPIGYAGPAPLEVEGLAQINVPLQCPGILGIPFGRPPIVELNVSSPDGRTIYRSDSVQLWTR